MRVAVYQPDAGCEDWQQRLTALDLVLQQHVENKPDIVLCPELFVSGYADAVEVQMMSDSVKGEAIGQLKELAQGFSVDLCVGYPELDGEARFNSACYLTATGRLLANHRKRALPSEYEKSLFDTGSELTVFDTSHGWRVGIVICYEVEFPEAVRACAKAGAQLVLAPTALGKEWAVVSRQLVPTRAFENNIFLAYSNYSGFDQAGEYIGDSVIVSPRGKDLVRAGSGPEFLTAELDPSDIETARARLPYLQDHPAVSGC